LHFVSELTLLTTSHHFLNPEYAFNVRTLFAAVLEVEIVEYFLRLLVTLVDALNLCLLEHVFCIKTIDPTAFEWMVLLLAIQTENKFTVLALSIVLFLIDVSQGRAVWDRAPAHIVHLVDRVPETQVLPLVIHFLPQIQITDVQIG